MELWMLLVLVLVLIVVAVGVVALVQGKRRSGGVIAARKDRGDGPA